MKRTLLLVLLLLGGAAAGLYAAGLLPWGKPTDPEGPAGRRPDGQRPATEDGPGLRPSPAAPAREVPTEEPPPQRLLLQRPLKTLILVERVTSWPAFVASALREDPFHVYRCYSADPVGPEPSLNSAGQEPLLEPPTAAWLGQQDIDVIVLAGMDPKHLEDAFWQTVAERVRARSLGLFVMPGFPPLKRGQSVTPAVHPIFEQPSLAALLPAAEPRRIEGSPVPGTFTSPADAPFVVTDAGTEHPASRIVAFPEWSRRIWQVGASGPAPWGSLFVYPIAALREGAVRLVDVQPAKGAALPMYVLGPDAAGRVLWFGASDFGELTYRDPRSVQRWSALLHNAVVFLAGRAP